MANADYVNGEATAREIRRRLAAEAGEGTMQGNDVGVAQQWAAQAFAPKTHQPDSESQAIRATTGSQGTPNGPTGAVNDRPYLCDFSTAGSSSRILLLPTFSARSSSAFSPPSTAFLARSLLS